MIDDAHTPDRDALAAAIARSVSGPAWTVAIAESATRQALRNLLAALQAGTAELTTTSASPSAAEDPEERR